MYYLLFTLYLAIATYLIMRSPFIKKTGLTVKIIVALFLLKVFAGLAIGWICQRFYPVNDYWFLHNDGLYEYHLLMNDPHEFFTNIFKSPYKEGYTGFFNAVGSYWNDLRYNLILKMLAFFDIFSRGNYYINSLFFNFFGFFGIVALFRVFADIYKNTKWPLVAGCFILPSTLYYSSGIGKDLIILTMLGFFCYALYFSMTQKFTVKRGLTMFLSFITILLIRNFIAVALIPVSLAFFLSIKKRTNSLVTFVCIFAGMFLILIILQFLIPSFQPLKIITQRQTDFLNIPGTFTTRLSINELEPTLTSFAGNLPQAVDHGFFTPHLWDRKGWLLFILAFELFAYEALFLLVILRYRSRLSFKNPFILFCFFFSISMLLVTGYIIPYIGPIIRYRSIYLPFIIVPLLNAFFTKSKD